MSKSKKMVVRDINFVVPCIGENPMLSVVLENGEHVWIELPDLRHSIMLIEGASCFVGREVRTMIAKSEQK